VQIIVNHVTRMNTAHRICVAGIEKDSFAHVRPTTPASDLITRRLLRSEGGPFGPGAVVDLGEVVAEGRPPEVEDHRFRTSNARRLEDLSDELYLAVLDEVASADLTAAFGFQIQEIRPKKLAVPAGQGDRSLAVIPVDRPELYVDSWGKLFVDITAGGTEAKLRVTDVRFYDSDLSIRTDRVEDVKRRLARGVESYAMLGLARAIYDEDGGDVHWLQCNGICLADRATSDVP
jgi:hypothetical protein